MARDRRIPRLSPVTVDILINGTMLASTAQILSVEVERAVNEISEARIVLLAPPAGQPEIQVDESLVPGMDIEIRAGATGRPKTIFQGIITSLRIRSAARGGVQVHVGCSDRSVKMTLGRRNRVFSQMDDHGAIAAILADYGLGSSLGATAFVHPELVQYDATDWDFILSRARANGMILTNLDGHVNVGRPGVTSAPVMTVSYGKDLLDFELDLDARAQMVNVVSRGWDAGQQELSEGASKEPLVNEQGDISGLKLAGVLDVHDFRLQTSGLVAEAELDTWANARLLMARLSRIKGSLQVSGSARLLPDTLIELEGLSSRFNGLAYVSGVTHSIKEGDWTTTVVVGMADDWLDSQYHGPVASSASGLLPAVSGLQIGTVLRTDGDPEGQARVQVRLPLLESSGAAIWARLASFSASSQSGAFFLPEIGDEVVVGFLNDDPRFPVVIGSFYSRARRPPYLADPDNSVKAIRTRSGLKVEFNDQEERIAIATPAGNEVMLSDENQEITLSDQHGNKVEMSSAGITLHSVGELTISASGNLNLEGMNVTAKAQASFSAEGSAAAKLSAAGQTTIKGAMVMIN